jgi:predicted transcriptional regulator
VGPATIAETHAALARPLGYTTVQTRLNRLVDKGVVARTESRPAHYQATLRPDDVSRSELDNLVQRVSDGQVIPLVAFLVNDRPLSAEEIGQLKQLIDQAERQYKRRVKPTRRKETHE